LKSESKKEIPVYVETDKVEVLAEQSREMGGRFQPRQDDSGMTGLFIHPSAFLGVLVGSAAPNTRGCGHATRSGRGALRRTIEESDPR